MYHTQTAIFLSLLLHAIMFIPLSKKIQYSPKMHSKVSVTLVQEQEKIKNLPKQIHKSQHKRKLSKLTSNLKAAQSLEKKQKEIPTKMTFDSLIKNYTPPKYPLIAIRKNIEGEVLIKLEINSKGVVTQVNLLATSHSKLLDDSVLDVAKKWTFNNSKPIEIQKKIIFNLN